MTQIPVSTSSEQGQINEHFRSANHDISPTFFPKMSTGSSSSSSLPRIHCPGRKNNLEPVPSLMFVFEASGQQRMLRECFERHTFGLLKFLKPHAVLLSSAPTHSFKSEVLTAAPSARRSKLRPRSGQDFFCEIAPVNAYFCPNGMFWKRSKQQITRCLTS